MTELRFGEFRLDRGDERLWRAGSPVKLGNKAFRVLELLATQQGRLLTKDDLFSSVWDGTIVSESALTSVVKELRRALGDESRTPRFIESVYGRGYRFLAPVVTAQARVLDPEPEPPPPSRAERAPAANELGNQPLLYIPAPEDGAVRQSHPYLGETLREEVLFALSRFRDIRLVSDEEAAPASPAGGYGGREYQLSLKLLGRGAGVRVFARLSRLSSREIIWAETAELEDGDIGQLVDQLVRSIAAAALPSLQDDLARHLPQQARDAYTRYFQNKVQMRCQTSLEAAKQLADSWERLIDEHSGFAQAYPPLIRLLNTDYCFTGLGSTGPQERSRAYELAHRAVGLDSADAHIHTAKAWCHLWAGEARLAVGHFEEALRLNPYNQSRLIEASTGFMFLDDLDRASDLLDRSRDLSPFAIQAPHEEQGLLRLLSGDFDSAASHLALVRRAHPEDAEVTEPSILSELYALLAAAGVDSPDLTGRSLRWQERMAASWALAEPPDAESLTWWAAYHNPLQTPERRQWMLGLLDKALRSAGRATGRTRGRAGRETPFAPAPESGTPLPA